MDHPRYTTVLTFNIWALHAWEERQPALRAFFQQRPGDVVAIQELRPESRALIDATLTDHDRVDDDLVGWSTEANIWWNRHVYRLVAHGAEAIGHKEPDRRMFWVRLASVIDPSTNLVVANVHLTSVGHPDEYRTHINPRIGQMQRAVGALEHLVDVAEPCIVLGDFNDYRLPCQVLVDAGFDEAHNSLNRMSPPTHVYPPARPDDGFAGRRMELAKPIDWQFHRGALRPVSAEVVEHWHDGIPPSDHKAVFVTYDLR